MSVWIIFARYAVEGSWHDHVHALYANEHEAATDCKELNEISSKSYFYSVQRYEVKMSEVDESTVPHDCN